MYVEARHECGLSHMKERAHLRYAFGNQIAGVVFVQWQDLAGHRSGSFSRRLFRPFPRESSRPVTFDLTSKERYLAGERNVHQTGPQAQWVGSNHPLNNLKEIDRFIELQQHCLWYGQQRN